MRYSDGGVLSEQGRANREVVRLQALGATVFAEFNWTVMLDPEGNEFCVEKGPGDRKNPEEVAAQPYNRLNLELKKGCVRYSSGAIFIDRCAKLM